MQAAESLVKAKRELAEKIKKKEKKLTDLSNATNAAQEDIRSLE